MARWRSVPRSTEPGARTGHKLGRKPRWCYEALALWQEGFFDLAEAPDEGLQYGPGDVRVVLQEGPELPLGEDETFELRYATTSAERGDRSMMDISPK